MTSSRIPDSSSFNGPRGAQLERIEAELARIVGFEGSQALLARSRQLCGSQEPPRTLLIRRVLQLVRKLLGKPVVRWLLQSASEASHTQPVQTRLR
jgi:hypothetical protein